MCFTTRRSKLKRAKKDIVCYKIMAKAVLKSDGRVAFFRSYYQNFEYEPGVIYNDKSELNMRFCRLFGLTMTKGGYHSYKYECAVYDGDDIVVKCIIPKGSLYLENIYFYCSTAIKVVEIV